MKPLLFISHSARNDPKAEAALKTLQTGLGTDWDIFIDRERIIAGERWRDHIHSALAVCDAAVILFSKTAYDDSEWVLKEATIFGWRQALDPSFRLVCALFPEVKPEDLSCGKYKAVFLGELLWVDVTKADLVTRLKATLGTPSAEAPGKRIVSAIAHRFRKVPDRDLQIAMSKLGKTLEWNPAINRRERFARDLLHAALPDIRAAFKEIETYMDPGDIHEVNRYLIPFAINPLATSKLPKAALSTDASSQRVFAVNATEGTTGEHYVQRARCHPNPWPIVMLANAGGHDTSGSLKRELLDAIRVQASEIGESEQEIAAMLDFQQKDGSPLFVVVHGPVDSTTIEWLRRDFPWCTFLVLAGEDATEDEAIETGVELLAPVLEPKRELEIVMHFRAIRVIAENHQRRRT